MCVETWRVVYCQLEWAPLSCDRSHMILPGLKQQPWNFLHQEIRNRSLIIDNSRAEIDSVKTWRKLWYYLLWIPPYFGNYANFALYGKTYLQIVYLHVRIFIFIWSIFNCIKIVVVFTICNSVTCVSSTLFFSMRKKCFIN